jgi:hypothetical protein
MPIYYPRIAAELTVPIIGSTQDRARMETEEDVVRIPLRPIRCRLERNDHLTADACSITVDWTEAGVDPRLLDDATIEVFIANADEAGHWTPSFENLRFVGITKKITAQRSSGEPGEVTLDCVDYTTLFLHAKPFGSDGIPSYDQTLTEAWRRIVSQTPGADRLADRLVFEGGVDPNLILGKAVAARFQKLSAVPVRPNCDAWAVWLQCVGMLGLISFIDLDTCVVTTARNLYTVDDQPVFKWGTNLLSWSETRDCEAGRRGIGLTSYDPLTRTTIESFYPPIGDTRVKRKRAKAKKAQSDDQIRQSEERVYYSLPGITDQETLDRAAAEFYEEIRRQEVSGKITTAEMQATAEGGTLYDLLNLRAGDAISVDATPENLQLLQSLDNDNARITRLREQGYEPAIAELIVKNLANIGKLNAYFHVRSLTIDLEFAPEEVNFGVEVDYLNQIALDGSSK